MILLRGALIIGTIINCKSSDSFVQIRIADLHTFSEKLEIEGKATDQKASGRCWLFAATNVLRLHIIKKCVGVKFGLSSQPRSS